MAMALLEVSIYALISIFLLALGTYIFDLLVPYDFQTEIREGNTAAAWTAAGFYIGLGFVIRSAIITYPVGGEVSDIASQLYDGLLASLVWTGVGVVFLAIGYFIIDFLYRKVKITKEIAQKNTAAGILAFGIFLSIAFVITGAIQ